MTSPPTYHRLLRLRHVRPGPATTFLLFEGSVGLGLLLGLSEIVSWWGVVVVPAAVAIMVKLNDVVAGSLSRPLALAQLQAPRILDRAAVGRSPVPLPSHPTGIAPDAAVAEPWAYSDPFVDHAEASHASRAVGVAAVPSAASGRRPSPGARTAEMGIPASAAEHAPAPAQVASSGDEYSRDHGRGRGSPDDGPSASGGDSGLGSGAGNGAGGPTGARRNIRWPSPR